MPKPLAVQLYTFRDPARFGGAGLGLDPEGLEAIAAEGYAGVETVDVPGGDPVAARGALANAGLTATSAHTWARIDDADAFDRAAAAAAELGVGSIIVSANEFATAASTEAYTDRLNAAARIAAKHGLRVAHHNHDTEMRPVDGVPAYGRMLDRLDPAVALQLDIFWVTVGGADPARVIAELGDRLVSLHVKDGVVLPARAYGAEAFVNVPVGDGVVDVAGAVAAAEALPGIAWLIVEFDHVDGSPMAAARQSHDNLVARGLARGRVT
jgi:sugar phosphate isomerase/epimerase